MWKISVEGIAIHYSPDVRPFFEDTNLEVVSRCPFNIKIEIKPFELSCCFGVIFEGIGLSANPVGLIKHKLAWIRDQEGEYDALGVFVVSSKFQVLELIFMEEAFYVRVFA